MTITGLKAALLAWLKQPTTVAGISGFAATLAYALAHLAAHDMPLPAILAGLAASIVAMVLPDNSGERSSVEKLVQDSVTAAATQHLAAALPALVQDAMAVVRAVSVPAAPAPGATTPAAVIAAS